MAKNGNRELTVTALILGVLLAVVLGAANAYLGLRVGLTVSASVPAAVISMGETPWTAACQAPLSSTISQSLLQFITIYFYLY